MNEKTFLTNRRAVSFGWYTIEVVTFIAIASVIHPVRVGFQHISSTRNALCIVQSPVFQFF